MLIDCHSHVWKAEFLTGQFQEDMEKFVREAGKAAEGRVTNADRDRHARAMENLVDRAIVFGLQASFSGVSVPNDYVAEYAQLFPEKIVGFSSVDPLDPGARLELERSYYELGLKGLKLGPIYQNVHPHDRRFYPLYQRCAELNMPIVFHQSSTTPRSVRLAIASPLLIEDLAIEFPQLKIQIAHMGHPWYIETIQVLRKQPNVCADISSLWPRPWQFYNALILAQEYGVVPKLLFGTDFPFGTARESIDSLIGLNRMVEGTNLPQIREDTISAIIYGNAERIYGFLWS